MLELWSVVIFTTIVAVAFAILVGRRLPFAIWSPIYGMVGVYLILGISGFFYYRFSRDYVGGFYDIGVSADLLVQALTGFFAAVGAFLVGALIYLLPSSRFRRLHRSQSQKSNAKRTDTPRSHIRVHEIRSIILLLIPLALTVIGRGPMNLWSRTQYLTEEFHYLLIVGMALSMPAMLALGVLTRVKRSIIWRAICVCVLILYAIAFLALSTRRLIIAFLLYILGLALANARRRTIVLLLAIWVIILPLALSILTGLRDQPQQGLLPFFHNIAKITSNSSSLFVDGTYLIFQNLAFGVPLSGFVKNVSPLPIDILITSLNPLPSFVPVPGLPLWENIRDQLRVNTYIPYSALGELLNYGWLWLLLYYIGAGIVAAWVDVGIRTFQNTRSRWGFLVASGLIFLFSITSTQYNLRSATRALYYAVAVALAWRLFCRLNLPYRNKM